MKEFTILLQRISSRTRFVQALCNSVITIRLHVICNSQVVGNLGIEGCPHADHQAIDWLSGVKAKFEICFKFYIVSFLLWLENIFKTKIRIRVLIQE